MIKSAAAELPPEQTHARLRNECFMARRVDSPRVPRVLELVDDAGELALVFERDPKLVALDRRLADGPAGIVEALRVSLAVLEALAEVHAQGLVHRDLKPANILVDPGLSRAQLIDFGIATIVPRTLDRREPDTSFAGTLGFMAPEQTGRINRPVDYRSDYYGLGATLYWMLVGRHPFAEHGRGEELVHALLTRLPRDLRELDDRIPPAVAGIVAKLLSKDAGDRYQGSFGLRADLNRCLEQLEAGAATVDFELARVDPSERLLPPRRLYGRDRERAELLAVRAPRPELGPRLALVHGPSGCGKSALVAELREAVDADPAAVFAACKFDPVTRASPNAGVGAILRHLFTAVEAAAGERLGPRIEEQLGSNAGLLCDLVPELEGLLGELERPAPVAAAQARDRFWDTVARFVDALCMPELEICLFVDDLQWAEASSLELLESLCLGPPRALSVVLAAREQALGDDQALTRTLARLAAADFEIVDIELGPLDEAGVVALVDDLLAGSPDAGALARLIHRRTRGGPLFVTQLLSACYAEGIIDVDRGTGRWRVDLERARAQASSGELVDFLAAQFDSLPEAQRRLLGIAACVGARFDLETLAAAAEDSREAIGAALWSAVAGGFLRPVGTARGLRSGELSTVSEARAPRYAFVHDRIQEVAAASLELDLGALHLELARRLAVRAPPAERCANETLRRIAGHLAEARAQGLAIEGSDERRRFARLAFEAGRRSKAAAGFDAAGDHFALTTELLAALEDEAERRFEARLELAECLALAGDRPASEAAYRRLHAEVVAPLPRARLLLSHITLAMVPGDTERALELVLEAAEAFDLDLRAGGSEAWFGATLSELLGEVEAIGHEAIVARPALDDPLQDCICQLALAATNAAYLAGDIHLYGALALAIIRVGLRHGVSDATGVAFMQIAIILASGLEDYAGTRRYAELAEALLERFPDSPHRGMFEVIRGSTIQPWVEALLASLPRLSDAHARLRADGLLTNAGYAEFCVVMNGFWIGVPLPRVRADAERAVAYLETIGDRPLAAATRAYGEAAAVFAGASEREEHPLLVDHEAGALARLNPATHFNVHATRGLCALLLDDAAGLDAAIAAAEPTQSAGTGLIAWIVHRVVVALRGCQRYPNMSDEAREDFAATMAGEREWLERWAASCPDNGEPFRALVDAAWLEARGELEGARRAFARAADVASEARVHCLAGYANERGAAVALALDDPRLALGFFEHARRSYARWGARRLERRVDERLRELGRGAAPVELGAGESELSASTKQFQAFDVSSIVKMSLALSETTSLPEVVARLLTATSENAGADRSALLLERERSEDSGLELHAIYTVDEPLRSFDPPLPLAEAGALVPASLIRACVGERSPRIIDDLEVEPGADADPYLRRAELRSALALPLDERGSQLGVLYFENHLTPGAFTHRQLRVLKALAGQAAVTLDGARLFEALREREARWRSLVDSAPDAILIVDRRHRVEFCNHAEFCSLAASPRIEELFVAEQRERIAATLDEVFSTGAPGSFEARRALESGPRTFTVRIGPIVRERVVERVTLIATDVTEQRELETQLRQAQKMQAIGTLAGGVAHDFNNLLTVIIGACDLGHFDLLSQGLPRDAQAFRCFEEIGEAGERASQLTRQLLAFSRKQVLQPERFDLNELVRALARMLARLIGESVSLHLRLDDEPCWLHADPGQIEQVVMNLAVNARDAMPEGGRLIIATSQRRGGADPARIELCVEDTGAGMSPKLQSRIFEPFFTTKEAGQGTGLGLSTVLGIVEQSGGRIELDSALGQGTRFRVLLPVAPADAEAGPGEAEVRGELPRGSERVLIIEDEDSVRSTTAEVLTSLGYTVFEADAEQVALEHARAAEIIDLVFADLVLPGANGPEVAKAVAQLHPDAQLLYTSGYLDDELRRIGLGASSSLLRKPYSPAQLAQAVRQALDAEPN